MLLPDTLYKTEVVKCIWDNNSGQNLMLVMTVASLVEPFLTIQHRENLSQVVMLTFFWGLIADFVGILSLYCATLCCDAGST